ncbi:MAG: hypothetical protein II960_07870 [Synergistaceae bacterium]|nr:hypothetical protein [Synergistaceae bacterium]
MNENYILINAIEDVCYNACPNLNLTDMGGCCESWKHAAFREDCPFRDYMLQIEDESKKLFNLINEVSKLAKDSEVTITDEDDDFRYYPENDPIYPYFIPYPY